MVDGRERKRPVFHFGRELIMEKDSLKEIIDVIHSSQEELDGTLMVLNSHLERIAKALEKRNKIEIAKDEILKAATRVEFNLAEKGKLRERQPEKPRMRRRTKDIDYIQG